MNLFLLCLKLLVTYLAIGLVFIIILLVLKWMLYFLHYVMCYIETGFDKAVQIQLKYRYSKTDDISSLWLMKLKYLGRTADEKILDLWAGIRPPNPFSVTHLFMILLTWFCVSSESMTAVFTPVYDCIRAIDYEPYRKPAITVICIPAAYMTFQYLLFRIKYQKVIRSISEEFDSALDHTRENIKSLDSFQIDKYLNTMADQITDRIGYTYQDKKLTRNKHSTSSSIQSLQLKPVFKLYRKLAQSIGDMKLCDGGRSFLDFSDTKRCFSYNRRKERWLFEQMEPVSHHELISYFQEGHVQIYAKLHTNLRIIREDRLSLLENMEAKAEDILKMLEDDLKDYRSENCMLDYRLKSYRTYLDRMFFNHNVFITVASVLYYVIKQYLKGIWAFLY